MPSALCLQSGVVSEYEGQAHSAQLQVSTHYLRYPESRSLLRNSQLYFIL